MNTYIAERRPLFCEKEDVIPNTLVLAWTSLGWSKMPRCVGMKIIRST
jgi:hypothetical protein